VTIGAGTRIKEAIILDRAEIKVIIITLVIIHTVMAKTNYDTNECLVSFIM
jgi:hypothetical protein